MQFFQTGRLRPGSPPIFRTRTRHGSRLKIVSIAPLDMAIQHAHVGAIRQQAIQVRRAMMERRTTDDTNPIVGGHAIPTGCVLSGGVGRRSSRRRRHGCAGDQHPIRRGRRRHFRAGPRSIVYIHGRHGDWLERSVLIRHGEGSRMVPPKGIAGDFITAIGPKLFLLCKCRVVKNFAGATAPHHIGCRLIWNVPWPKSSNAIIGSGTHVRKRIIKIIGIQEGRKTELLDVARAFDANGFFFGPRQSGQQQRRQDGDDGNDYQQFDKGKTA